MKARARTARLSALDPISTERPRVQTERLPLSGPWQVTLAAGKKVACQYDPRGQIAEAGPLHDRGVPVRLVLAQPNEASNLSPTSAYPPGVTDAG